MRVATWAIQERDGVLEDARAKLLAPSGSPAPAGGVDTRREALLDVVHRAFVARLSGAAVHPGTVADLRRTYGEGQLVAAAQGIAEALRARVEGRAGHDPARLQAERQAISQSLDELMALFDPEGADGGALDIDVVDGPRPTLVHAIRELAAGPPPSSEVPAPRRVLLRVRATTVAAARALDEARASLAGPGLAVLPSAPDELLVGASGDVAAAVGRAVHVAGALARSLAAALPELLLALVVDGEDPLDAVVRAGALAQAPGLLVLDEAAWSAASAAGTGLAPSPGAPRAVDPAAAFGHDRWELSALLAQSIGRPLLFGRDDEVERLARLLVDPSDAPVLALLHGPAGIGKTSLVRAALRAAGYDDEAAPVLWGAADPVQPTPYAAVAAMLRALAGAPAGHPHAAARVARLVEGLADVLQDARGAGRDDPHATTASDRVDAARAAGTAGAAGGIDGVEQGADELRALLPVLITLLGAGDDDASTDERSPRVLRVGLRRALYLVSSALLARADDGRPAVFVVPGADVVDGPTREALAFAAARLRGRARVLLLSTSRLRLPSSFEGAFRVERLEVRGLPAPAARSLVGALLDRPEDDEALGSLVEKARGSPLALLHGVRFAVEGGLVRRRDDRWDASDVDARDLPGRVDRLLRGRVERLPAHARRLLGGCAALGLSFLPAPVEFVGVRLGMKREEVARALAFLVDTGFLVRSQPRPGAPVFADAVDEDRALAFEHPLLRAAAEACLDPDERKQVHAVVADALEAVVPTGLHALAPSLARHHRLAGRVEAALDELTVAVRRSALLDDRQGAVALARQGLELAGDDAKAAFPFHLELEAIREGAGRAAHKDALKQLVRAAERSGEARLRGHALLRVARFNLGAGDPALAEDAATRALAELRSIEATTPSRSRELRLDARAGARLETQALRLLSLARFHRRDLDGAAAVLAEARARTPADDRRGLAMVEQQEGLLLLERGDALGAVEHLLAARAHRAALADLAGEAASIDAAAEAFARRGRTSIGLELLRHAGRLRQRIGDDAGRAAGRKNEADLLFGLGDDDAALAAATEAHALARELGLDRLESAAALASARVHLRRGALDVAERLVDGVRRRSRDASSSVEAAVLGARARLARAAATTGGSRERAVNAALSRARDAVALGEEHGLIAGRVLGMAAAGEALLLAGDAGAALPWAQQAVELLDDPQTRALSRSGLLGVAPEEVLGVYALVLDANGDDEEAAAVRARAMVHLERRRAGQAGEHVGDQAGDEAGDQAGPRG